MTDTLRKPFLVIALVLLALTVLAETGSGIHMFFIGEGTSAEPVATPGWGIPYLAVLDGLVLFTILLIGAPLLIIHGEQDEVIAFDFGQALFEAAAEPKQFWGIPGAGHSNIVATGDSAYLERLEQF